jgi:hypothetical protein
LEIQNMTSIKRVISISAVVIMTALGFAARAGAAPIVSIDPTDTLVNAGDVFSVDIVVDNTGGGLLGGFSAILFFNDTLLQGDSFVTDPDSNFTDGVDLSLGFIGLGTSPLDLFFFGAPIAGQPTSFRLATVSFTALVDGVSPLHLSGLVLSNEDGSQSITATAKNGQVCIGGPCPVPEPGLLVLISTAAAVFGVRRMRRTT